MEKAGVLHYLANTVSALAHENIIVAAVAIMWISAIASAAVDNIPFTMAMIPVIQNLESLGVPVNILWWSLALGVGFGGNGTPIGSTANVVVVAKSEQTDDPITFKSWFKSGSIAMLATCIVAMICIIVFHTWLEGPHR
jgi:Na+/H+ antiporter NhaD/arsenite permease-like protein